MDFTFFEVVGNPNTDGHCTVADRGTANLLVENAQGTVCDLADVPVLINGHTYCVGGDDGSQVWTGWVHPGTRLQRKVKFARLHANGATQDSFKIALLAGDLAPGDTVAEVKATNQPEALVQSSMLCFTKGARILTAFGDVPIEDLRVGDLIHTVDNGLQPVKWIGAREVGPARLHAEPNLRPVRIAAHSFGHGRPYADLRLSRHHRILLEDGLSDEGYSPDGLLAAIDALVNGSSITETNAADGVTYFHLLFEDHQLLYVEGFEAESFFPTPAAIAAMVESDRDSLFAALPRLRDNPLGYGAPARRTASPAEARQRAA
ncbi:MAG: Hint domain-containing protein [Pseudomonadota bacterium]